MFSVVQSSGQSSERPLSNRKDRMTYPVTWLKLRNLTMSKTQKQTIVTEDAQWLPGAGSREQRFITNGPKNVARAMEKL